MALVIFNATCFVAASCVFQLFTTFSLSTTSAKEMWGMWGSEGGFRWGRGVLMTLTISL